MPNRDYRDERREYEFSSLDVNQVDQDPFEQFLEWMETAHQNTSVKDATAMSVSTVSADGQPHSRIVLLKEFNPDGFVFYTNYDSAKGLEISSNAKAALLFFWPEMDRQIRIEGQLEKISEKTSTDYFHSRPRDSQLAAFISQQSQIIKDRKTLEKKLADATKAFENMDIPKPEAWGGYRLKANYFEFWQGRPSRLHDRFSYHLLDTSHWAINRLSP